MGKRRAGKGGKGGKGGRSRNAGERRVYLIGADAALAAGVKPDEMGFKAYNLARMAAGESLSGSKDKVTNRTRPRSAGSATMRVERPMAVS